MSVDKETESDEHPDVKNLKSKPKSVIEGVKERKKIMPSKTPLKEF